MLYGFIGITAARVTGTEHKASRTKTILRALHKLLRDPNAALRGTRAALLDPTDQSSRRAAMLGQQSHSASRQKNSTVSMWFE